MFILKWIGIKILSVIAFVTQLFETVIDYIHDHFKDKKEEEEYVNNAVTMYKYFGDVIKKYAPEYKVNNRVVKSNISFDYSIFTFSNTIVLNYYSVNGKTNNDALNIWVHYIKHKIDSISLFITRPVEIMFESPEAAVEFIKTGNVGELVSISDQYQKDMKILNDKYKTEIELLKL